MPVRYEGREAFGLRPSSAALLTGGHGENGGSDASLRLQLWEQDYVADAFLAEEHHANSSSTGE